MSDKPSSSSAEKAPPPLRLTVTDLTKTLAVLRLLAMAQNRRLRQHVAATAESHGLDPDETIALLATIPPPGVESLDTVPWRPPDDSAPRPGG